MALRLFFEGFGASCKQIRESDPKTGRDKAQGECENLSQTLNPFHFIALVRTLVTSAKKDKIMQ